MGLNVPVSPVDKTVYENDQISDPIYMSVLKQMYNYYRVIFQLIYIFVCHEIIKNLKLFNGNISDLLNLIGSDNLRINLKEFYDNVRFFRYIFSYYCIQTYYSIHEKYIEKKLHIRDCDIMNTFNGIHFMSLDRTIYLKIQSLLNLLEEKVPLVNKTVVMYCDQVIWSGLDQQDISLIYNYLKDLVNSNLNNNLQHSNSVNNNSNGLVRFLIDESIRKKALNTTSLSPTTSKSTNDSPPIVVTETNDEYYEFDKVHLGQNFEKYYLIPYNLSKLTFFIFIQVNKQFKLNILNKIDDTLAPNMINILQDISEQRNQMTQDEKEIKYIYFNRLNLAQKSTLNLNNSKETPKYIINLISQLSKDLERFIYIFFFDNIKFNYKIILF
jgi:hypothetical protein